MLVAWCMDNHHFDIRRSADRFHTQAGWLDSHHSFSFGRHHDPTNTGHGQLLVLNDDRVAPNAGFDTHPHRDMEIITWVLSGALEHRDSEGNEGVIRPGLAQRMSAGRGIWHSEKNASATEEVHFIQMWVTPDTNGIDPSYEQHDVADALAGGGLVAVAAGDDPDAAITIAQRDATLWVGHLSPEELITVPDGDHVHVFVAGGSGTLGATAHLHTGDAVRLYEADPLAFRAGNDGSEVLIWRTGPGSA